MATYHTYQMAGLRLVLKVLLADESQQLRLAFVKSERLAKRYEYAVLVTDLTYDVPALAQLYRDRADSENTFDELKNQWGWGGDPTQAGQQHLKITPMHSKGEQAKAMLTRVSRLLHEWKQIAEQLNLTAVWQQACQYITTAVTGFNGLGPPQNTHLLTDGIG